MKTLKKILTCTLTALLFVTAIFATGCGNGGNEKDNLLITFYEGGFGKKWLENVADDFVAKKAEEGVSVKVTLSGQGPDIDSNVDTFLSSGRNLSDIYMVRTRSSWASDVTSGYLANLNSVYETEVEKLDGTKIKIKDYMMDEISGMPYMQKVPEQGNKYPWIMPWSVLETSIIYNEDLLKKTNKSTGGKWTEPPRTMSELADLCNDINSTSAANGYGKTVAPIAWAEGGINYFQNIIYCLWAQQQGVEVSNIEGEGSFYDFWNFATPEVWKQTGIQKGIDEWKEIMVDSNGAWKNSIENVSQITFQESCAAFSRQESVMLLGGSFFENEMSTMLDRDGDGKSDFSFKMMTVPVTANCVQKDGHDAVMNFCSTDDLMLVPAKATNVELAKEFLAFMCNERYLVDFSVQTGCLRPFKYDPVKLTENDENVKWSDFFYSCYDMMKSDYNIFTYPKTAAEKGEVSLIYTYRHPELFQDLGVTTACLYMKNKSGKEIMTGSAGVYSSAAKSWNQWKSDLEI